MTMYFMMVLSFLPKAFVVINQTDLTAKQLYPSCGLGSLERLCIHTYIGIYTQLIFSETTHILIY